LSCSSFFQPKVCLAVIAILPETLNIIPYFERGKVGKVPLIFQKDSLNKKIFSGEVS